MNALKNKSEFNLEGAKVLIENALFAPSVHCSYYAVFQKLKYYYAKENGLTNQALGRRISSDKRNSHKFIIDEFCNLYLARCQYSRRELFNKIKDLKSLREESDYDNVQIDSVKSEMALSQTETIIKTIKKYF